MPEHEQVTCLCPYCINTGEHDVVHSQSRLTDGFTKETEGISQYDVYSVLVCAGCKHAFLFLESFSTETFADDLSPIPEKTEHYPGLQLEALPDATPDSIQAIFAETLDTFDLNLDLLCAINLRTCIRQLEKYHPKRKPKKLESKLKKYQKYTDDDIQIIDTILLQGNAATHEMMVPDRKTLLQHLLFIHKTFQEVYATKSSSEEKQDAQKHKPRALELGTVLPEKLFCPDCQIPTNHIVAFEHRNDDEQFLAAQCCGCDSVSAVIDATVYPQAPVYKHEAMSHSDYLPKSTNTIYTEALTAYNQGLLLSAAIGLRSVIESISLDSELYDIHRLRHPTVEGIELKINTLQSLKIITDQQAKLLHTLRKIGNNSMHKEIELYHKHLELCFVIIETVLHSQVIQPILFAESQFTMDTLNARTHR